LETITRSTFNSNNAVINGSAIYSKKLTLNINSSTFTNQQQAVAICVEQSIFSFRNSAISNANTAAGALVCGGALNLYSTYATISNSTISSNQADKGSAFCLYNSTMIATNIAISNNVARNGQTISSDNLSNATLINSSLYNNNGSSASCSNTVYFSNTSSFCQCNCNSVICDCSKSCCDQSTPNNNGFSPLAIIIIVFVVLLGIFATITMYVLKRRKARKDGLSESLLGNTH